MNTLDAAIRKSLGRRVTLFFVGGQELDGDVTHISAESLNQPHVLTLKKPGRDPRGTAYVSSTYIAGLVIHEKEKESQV